ncbi:hypothetical protein BP6252_13931 [Coleophoma cylindrospora]|uniref:Uncharacterized protein n=1 Tax=Coleophoma cylindrospora TaxID=1849047 RepID=A0A3D8Q5C8_9HELO|nr:hypothetical protein BP6252_13931 [Coleophoma cylindrospora]
MSSLAAAVLPPPAAGIVPLAMSQSKKELLRHVNMSLDTYTLMANEASCVYKWLISDIHHLKKHCKRQPPEWSDILEKSKEEATVRLSNSGDPHTSYYWMLAIPTEDCLNWIARWFLYHKFRYRDGRNRPKTRMGGLGGQLHDSTNQHYVPLGQQNTTSADPYIFEYQDGPFREDDLKREGSQSASSYDSQIQSSFRENSQGQDRIFYQSTTFTKVPKTDSTSRNRKCERLSSSGTPINSSIAPTACKPQN